MVTVVTVMFGQRNVGSGEPVAMACRVHGKFWFVKVKVVFRTLAGVRRWAGPAGGDGDERATSSAAGTGIHQHQKVPYTLALGGCSMGLMVVGTSRATSLRSGGGGGGVMLLSEAWSTALCTGLVPSVTT